MDVCADGTANTVESELDYWDACTYLLMEWYKVPSATEMKLEIERRSRRLEYEENSPSRRRVTLEHLPSRKEKRKCITQLESQVKVTIWSDHKVWSHDKLKIKRKWRYRAGSGGAINWSAIKQIKFECCCKPNWLKKKLRLTRQMSFVAIILVIYVNQVSIDMKLGTRGIIG